MPAPTQAGGPRRLSPLVHPPVPQSPLLRPGIGAAVGMRGTDSLQDRLAAQDYFDKHDIRRLLRELTEELYIRRPSDPVRFLAEKLAARAEQQTPRTDPVLEVPALQRAGNGARLLRLRVESHWSSGKRIHREISSLVPAHGASAFRILASAKRGAVQAVDEVWSRSQFEEEKTAPTSNTQAEDATEADDEHESPEQSMASYAAREGARGAGVHNAATDQGHEQQLLLQLQQLRYLRPLLREHDKRARELGINEQELSRVHRAVNMTPGPTPKGSFRVLSWNLLADGLSNDGFLVRDVLRQDLPDHRSVGALQFGAMVDEVSTVKRENGDIQKLKKKYDTPRSQANHAAVMDWVRRWLQTRALIAATAPDIVALQELDHMADAEKELGELGYTCKLPASAACYKPIHAILEGTVRRQDEAYLAHLRKTGVAFAPKTYSNCRKFGLESNRASADDDGVAIFWREDVFRATAIDFLSFDDAKRNQVSLSWFSCFFWFKFSHANPVLTLLAPRATGMVASCGMASCLSAVVAVDSDSANSPLFLVRAPCASTSFENATARRSR